MSHASNVSATASNDGELQNTSEQQARLTTYLAARPETDPVNARLSTAISADSETTLDLEKEKIAKMSESLRGFDENWKRATSSKSEK